MEIFHLTHNKTITAKMSNSYRFNHIVLQSGQLLNIGHGYCSYTMEKQKQMIFMTVMTLTPPQLAPRNNSFLIFHCIQNVINLQILTLITKYKATAIVT